MNQKESWTEKLGRVITTCGNAILMNLLFLAACVPIVTIGQAWCGLLSAIRYNIRGEKWFAGFKAGFKTRFLRGTVFWVIGAAVAMYMLADFNYAMVHGATVPMAAAAVMFALAAMVTMSALLLNVYIPTDVSTWISNSLNMVFKAPLQLVLAAGVFWAPVIVALVVKDGIWYIYELGLVLICAFYTLIALGVTMLMKEVLLKFLIDARANGTLTAEEGKKKE